jgi:hypothetical protein
MTLDCTDREVQPRRDLLIGQALSHEPDDVDLTPADPEGERGPRSRRAERQRDGVVDGQP